MGSVGDSKLQATGEVFHLVVPQDLAGVYASSNVGIALGGGGSEITMNNNKTGVVIHLTAKQKGLALMLAPEGL